MKLNFVTLWFFVILLGQSEYVAFYLSTLPVYSTCYMQNTASLVEGPIQIQKVNITYISLSPLSLLSVFFVKASYIKYML